MNTSSMPWQSPGSEPGVSIYTPDPNTRMFWVIFSNHLCLMATKWYGPRLPDSLHRFLSPVEKGQWAEVGEAGKKKVI